MNTYYVNSNKNPSGAYPPPMTKPFKGSIPITDEQLNIFLEYNGFVEIAVVDDIAQITPNVSAFEAWKAEQEIETGQDQVQEQSLAEPSAEERISALEAELASLKASLNK